MKKYINRDDYLQYAGVDLEAEIQDNDNPSAKVTRFIREFTDWCCMELVKEYCCNELNPNLPDEWEKLPAWRKERFREGVMEQIIYVLESGATSRQVIISNEQGWALYLEGVGMSPDARKKFFLGAFCNIRRG